MRFDHACNDKQQAMKLILPAKSPAVVAVACAWTIPVRRVVRTIKIVIRIVVIVLQAIKSSFFPVVVTLLFAFLFCFVPIVSLVSILNGGVHGGEQLVLRFYVSILA